MRDTVIDKVIDFYKDENFQKSIHEYAKRIETCLNSIIENLISKNQFNSAISKKVVWRIKSEKSLREKLDRKGYFEKWNLDENVTKDESHKKFIENLPDLLGFRINCYFKEDEKAIYDSIVLDLRNDPKINLEESPNHEQQNGEKIYKISGKYIDINNNICFEIQVKSFTHDVWGEVDHRLIYKPKEYDPRIELKNNILKELFYVLQSTDKQLSYLYKEERTKDNALRELFYFYSREKIQKNTDLLGMHYKNFFDIFRNLNNSGEYLKGYLAKKLANENYQKEKLDCNKDLLTFYNENILNKFDDNKYKHINLIASELFEFESHNDFLYYIFYELEKKSFPPELMESGDVKTYDESFELNILNSFYCVLKKSEQTRITDRSYKVKEANDE